MKSGTHHRKIRFGLLVAVTILLLCGCTGSKPKKQIVGEGVKKEDIKEFYWTYASSAFPPDYQRYYFYVEDGKHFFYHEKREGEVFPLTEEHITVSGTVELSDEQWETFFGYLEGGTVKEREETADAGDSGPWMYLYWNGDKGVVQEFHFVSYGERLAFEDFCKSLK